MRFAILSLSACGLALASAQPAAADVLGIGKDKPSATATILDPQGNVLGKAVAVRVKGKTRDQDAGLRVTVTVRGLPRGEKGIHLHTVGACEGPAFTSAGGHWNPTGHQHGRDNPRGAHMGDLPNIAIDRRGRGTLRFRIEGAKLRGDGGLLDGDGAAIVIHASSDDNRTDPSGNSGARIACGVFRRD